MIVRGIYKFISLFYAEFPYGEAGEPVSGVNPIEPGSKG
jgi:hypothetical protein